MQILLGLLAAVGMTLVTAQSASANVGVSEAIIEPGGTFDGGANADATLDFQSRRTLKITDVHVNDQCPGDDLGAFGQVFVEFLDGSKAHTARWRDYDGCDSDASDWATKPAPPNPNDKVIKKAWIRVCLFDGERNRVVECKQGNVIFNRHV